MPWVAWLSTLLAFLGPAAFLAFGRRIRDVTRRGLGRRGGVLLCLRQFVLDSDKLLLQLSDSRRQFIAVLASVRRSGHRDQNLRQSAKCPYTNSQPVNGYVYRRPANSADQHRLLKTEIELPFGISATVAHSTATE